MWSWAYCGVRQGVTDDPQPAASVPWPETHAREAVCAWADAEGLGPSTKVHEPSLCRMPVTCAFAVESRPLRTSLCPFRTGLRALKTEIRKTRETERQQCASNEYRCPGRNLPFEGDGAPPVRSYKEGSKAARNAHRLTEHHRGRQAGRPAGPAVDQVRVGHQSANRPKFVDLAPTWTPLSRGDSADAT
jgi:hypothetical protein